MCSEIRSTLPRSLAALCKPDQILASGQLIEALPRELMTTVRYFDEVSLRGKQETIRVHELIWEVTDTTVAGENMPQVSRLEHSVCTLIIEDRIVAVGEDATLVEMGRAGEVELQCRGALTSRRHARIEFRRARFILTDQSANGTMVVPDGQAVVTLKRDYYTLDGSGLIGLGDEPRRDDPFATSYRCR